MVVLGGNLVEKPDKSGYLQSLNSAGQHSGSASDPYSDFKAGLFRALLPLSSGLSLFVLPRAGQR